MSIIRPFRGLRPKSELASRVASPPYDVLNRQEARRMAGENPLSFLRVVKAELEFPDEVDQYSQEVYQRAKENLTRLKAKEVMVRDSRLAFYVYRLTMGGHIQTGLVCLVSVAEYNAGRIKKHEHTRPEKVSDRADLIEHLQAHVGPVFIAYRWNETINNILKEITAAPATTGFESDDGVRHELWLVDRAATIEALVAAFDRLDSLYIADGHHRSQAAAEVCRRLTERQSRGTGEESYNYFLSVLFADKELKILPYNRVVKDLNGLTPEEFIAKAGRAFEVSSQDGFVTPERPHCFGVYCDGRWYRLSARPGSFDISHPTESIDAAILADNLIAPTLGITDPRTDDRIGFVGGIRGAEELVRLVDSGEYKIAFSLYPTSIDQLLKIADAGEVMPPKSTWFEPKLRSGMVVNLLTE